MGAYYNEIDPFAAAWLRELIREGLIADGEVDERSIAEVQPSDLAGFTQCHFFAGIGVWSYALRLAGWPDGRPVWTGSCPCQPFSAAGKQKGGGDDRHLWPYWARLIRECRPDTILGEQVESAIAHGWFDLVSDDLEAEGYAIGAVGFPACSVGAPHIRQRLYFVAESQQRSTERQRFNLDTAARGIEGKAHKWERIRLDIGNGNSVGELALTDGGQSGNRNLQRSGQHGFEQEDGGTGAMAHTERDGGRADQQERETQEGKTDGRLGFPLADTESDNRRTGKCGAQARTRTDGIRGRRPPSSSADGELGHAESGGCGECGSSAQPRSGGYADGTEQAHKLGESTGCGRQWFWNQPAHAQFMQANPWADSYWLPCKDGKLRPVPLEPAFFPLVDGTTPGRVGLLRGAGNAIVAQQAQAFIEAYMECGQQGSAARAGEER